ncbi:hypothetical protein CPC08DRAFT_817423 [Agrocybe pediades]|nr:hypothetical protein CPC08DRAFT_817423 [Agrocybe pediades]
MDPRKPQPIRLSWTPEELYNTAGPSDHATRDTADIEQPSTSEGIPPPYGSLQLDGAGSPPDDTPSPHIYLHPIDMTMLSRSLPQRTASYVAMPLDFTEPSIANSTIVGVKTPPDLHVLRHPKPGDIAFITGGGGLQVLVNIFEDRERNTDQGLRCPDWHQPYSEPWNIDEVQTKFILVRSDNIDVDTETITKESQPFDRGNGDERPQHILRFKNHVPSSIAPVLVTPSRIIGHRLDYYDYHGRSFLAYMNTYGPKWLDHASRLHLSRICASDKVPLLFIDTTYTTTDYGNLILDNHPSLKDSLPQTLIFGPSLERTADTEYEWFTSSGTPLALAGSTSASASGLEYCAGPRRRPGDRKHAKDTCIAVGATQIRYPPNEEKSPTSGFFTRSKQSAKSLVGSLSQAFSSSSSSQSAK